MKTVQYSEVSNKLGQGGQKTWKVGGHSKTLDWNIPQVKRF